MNSLRDIPDAQEIRCRAAEVRKAWTPAEKLRRTGLPPDTPQRLREFILGRSSSEWRTSPHEGRRVGEVARRASR